MAHSVHVTLQTFDEIDASVAYIAKDSAEAARRWRDRLLDDIATLQHFPLRHGLAPEAEAVGVALHQMMHGRYRVLYTVDSNRVVVHGVRHGARRPMERGELPGTEPGGPLDRG